MDDTSELILRQTEVLQQGTLFVNPTEAALLESLPSGHFVSLHYGDWQRLRRQETWTGQFGLDEALTTKVSHAVVWMPKARRELELLFAWTEAQMLPGSRLWLVGPKRGGIESGGKALKKRLGNGSKRDAARHCQLWEYRLAEPAQSFDPGAWLTQRPVVSPLAGAHTKSSRAIPAHAEGGHSLIIADIPGIFSEGRLDEGTCLLLSSLEGEPRSPLLDFACGAGVIAAAVLKRWPGVEATLLDVQWQALVAARRTLAANGMGGNVVAGDGLTDLADRFATIITNPPFHTGLKTDLSIVRNFIRQAKAHLLQDGVLWLVANAFLPYRELLEEQFPSVTTVAEDKRFRVYRAQARRAGPGR